MPTAEQVAGASDAFRLLSDPTRIKLLWALLQGESSVSCLADLVGASPTAVSQHLSRLRWARLVSVRREGTFAYYSAADEHVARLLSEALHHADHQMLGLPDHPARPRPAGCTRPRRRPAAMATELVHLSGVLKRPLVDLKTGDKLGRVQDLVARMDESPHPPIVGLVVKIGGRELFVPARKISAIEPGRITFDGSKVDLRRFERRPGELLLAKDLIGAAPDQRRGRPAHPGQRDRADPDRERVGGRRRRSHGPRHAAPPPARTPRPALGGRRHYRLGQHRTLRLPRAERPAAHPVPQAGAAAPGPDRDLVEAASHEEGEEIIEAVGQDPALEADVFEELDPEHQVEFVQDRSDEEAAQLLGSMAPDDAADMISEIDQERRAPILDLLPEPQRRKVRSLLHYHPETAGGLMSPDFLELPATTTVEEALEAIRVSTVPREALAVVFVSDPDDGHVFGRSRPSNSFRARATNRCPRSRRPSWDMCIPTGTSAPPCARCPTST